MRALAIAATGMNAQQLNVEVIANNIANINTTGFKRARAEFTDLLYQAERIAGAPNRGGQNQVPEGAQIGLGVRTSAIRNLHIQGALTNTTNKFDLALNGRGWFQVAGNNGELFYTRAGAFNKNETGPIVTADGYLLQPAITDPNNATQIVIN
jgi:flagellar basal-body rod protein FlgG